MRPVDELLADLERARTLTRAVAAELEPEIPPRPHRDDLKLTAWGVTGGAAEGIRQAQKWIVEAHGGEMTGSETG